MRQLQTAARRFLDHYSDTSQVKTARRVAQTLLDNTLENGWHEAVQDPAAKLPVQRQRAYTDKRTGRDVSNWSLAEACWQRLRQQEMTTDALLSAIVATFRYVKIENPGMIQALDGTAFIYALAMQAVKLAPRHDPSQGERPPGASAKRIIGTTLWSLFGGFAVNVNNAMTEDEAFATDSIAAMKEPFSLATD